MKQILVVDDSDVIRSIVVKTLQMYHYDNVLQAKDGIEGLKVARDNKGDLAMCVFDVNMPKMDGLTLVKEVRQFDKTTPIIMLTTETDKSKMITARANGATGWIIKPFEGEKFIKVVEMYLQRVS